MARDTILEPIRVRAYFLWEQAGRPEGGDMDFWDEARRQIEQEEAEGRSMATEG
ncbi:MAG: DUF2934 domain-containing protein [Janthinobacterium lividum]